MNLTRFKTVLYLFYKYHTMSQSEIHDSLNKYKFVHFLVLI